LTFSRRCGVFEALQVLEERVLQVELEMRGERGTRGPGRGSAARFAAVSRLGTIRQAGESSRREDAFTLETCSLSTTPKALEQGRLLLGLALFRLLLLGSSPLQVGRGHD